MLTAAGIIRDQRRAVEEVAHAVAALPVKAGPLPPASGGFRWTAWTLAALLGAIAGFGAQMVLRHRRPGATPDPKRAAREGDVTRPGAASAGEEGGADDRRHAA